MKLFHLSDLHLGKRLNDFSMIEEQAHILRLILNLIDEERPDAVLIAGDVYDKSVPSAEAVQLFDDFLFRLSAKKFDGKQMETFVISGNHDSPERLAFGSRLMNESGVHLSPVYDGTIAPRILRDEYGSVCVYMLPFLRPAHVRRFYPDDAIESYTDAMRSAISHMEIDPANRNILIAHQFVTGAERSESEDVSVGGADNVDASVFEPFDYVALGHLHGPQSAGGRETIRYCGAPLKYSFSEAKQRKSVTVVELGPKGAVNIRTLPLTPLHDMRELRGTYLELTAKSFYDGTAVDDYLRVTLTDEDDIPDAIGKLRVIYRNVMEVRYDNLRTRTAVAIDGADDAEQKTPLELFAEFYEKQNNQPLSGNRREYVRELMESIWEEAQ